MSKIKKINKKWNKSNNMYWLKVLSDYYSGSLTKCYLTFRGFLKAASRQEKRQMTQTSSARFHWAPQFGLVRHAIIYFPAVEGHQTPYHTVFWSHFRRYQAVPSGGGATHTAVCWLQAGKKLFLSVVAELFIYHFSHFYMYIFRWECHHVVSKFIVSLSK